MLIFTLQNKAKKTFFLLTKCVNITQKNKAMRTGLNFWQKAILLNFVVAFVCMFGVNALADGAIYIIAYIVVSMYLLRFVPFKKLKGYDDVA